MHFASAGESHGEYISLLVEDFPAGIKFDSDLVSSFLRKRRSGNGRSQRMSLENDEFFIDSGFVNLISTGAPISVRIRNQVGQPLFDKRLKERKFPRPGHVDFCAAEKYGYIDISTGAERSSARETVARVFAGALAQMVLNYFNIEITTHVLEIGGQNISGGNNSFILKHPDMGSAGGVVALTAKGLFPGLGSNQQWDKKLDSLLAMALMSIPSAKGVYIGDTDIHQKRGVKSLDLFTSSFHRSTNKAGGIEGGITNGEQIKLQVYFKPIPTQHIPVPSVSVTDAARGHTEKVRTDLYAVESAAVVCEAMVAVVLVSMLQNKFGVDQIDDMLSNCRIYLERLRWKN